jgi:hypothetical protein
MSLVTTNKPGTCTCTVPGSTRFLMVQYSTLLVYCEVLLQSYMRQEIPTVVLVPTLPANIDLVIHMHIHTTYTVHNHTPSMTCIRTMLYLHDSICCSQNMNAWFSSTSYSIKKSSGKGEVRLKSSL